MMAPETLAQAHAQTRQATDVVRVALERRGVIGFFETRDGMTLAEARALIWENVEDAPPEFQFVLADGAPVSARQEATQRIASFYPTVSIRESRRGSEASSVLSSSLSGQSTAAASEKVCVVTAAGDEFRTWVVEDYTFQQLRRDAARYWHLPAGQVALADADGCLWPEQARVLAVLGVEGLRERKLVLEYKVGALARRSNQPGPLVRSQSLSASLSTPPAVMTMARTASARRLHSACEWPVAADADTLEPNRAGDSALEELWRIFTFYCVNGDSSELESIKAHQFNRLLRDTRVFGGGLTPAMVDIIYMSETKGKPQASAKMSFDEFLNALVKVAGALRHSRGTAGSRRLRDAEGEDARFQELVADHILPRAARWPTHVWAEQTRRLRRPEVVAFVSKFLEPLLEIFMFYARSHTDHPATGVKEFYMAYADYQRFVTDFAFSSLQLSSVEAAQVFVAACSSPPFHAPLFGSEALDAEASGASGIGPAGSVMATVQRVLESVEGVVAYSFPENQVGRMCMGVSAFLDALGRSGLAAFAKTRPLKTTQCVKAVFHHLSRGLTRARVLEILKSHGPTSVRATRFYSGTVAFNNKFLDMWRYEGSPDYLAGDALLGSGVPSTTESPVSSGGAVCGTTSRQAGDKTTAVASQTLRVATSSAGVLRRATPSMPLDDKAAAAGKSGRGREALDRMVRNSLLRSTAHAKAGVVQVTAASSPPPIVDADAVAAESDPELAVDSSGSAVEPSKLLTAVEEEGDDARDVRSPVLVGGESDATAAAEKRSEPAASPSAGVGNWLVPMPPLAQMSRDDRSFYEGVLRKGGVFKKYGQWGSPHRRFVWLATDSDTVFWRPVDRKNALVREGVPVAAVVAVLPGDSPRTRYAFMKHLSDERAIRRCFSVVAEDRRLDLEADSEATRETWMHALRFLMKNPRKLQSSPLQS